MDKLNRLIIPSCSGLLDSFNTQVTRYYKNESICCLQGTEDSLLLLGLFSYIYQSKSSETRTYTFKISDFKHYIGYAGGGKSKDLPTELNALTKVVYLWQCEQYEKVIEIEFNQTKTVAILKSGYFELIIEQMRRFHGHRGKWGRKTGGQSTYSSLVYSTILKERNIPASEITIELVKLIERRGPLSEGEYAHIATQSLVDRCPTLYKQVQSAQENKEKNRILRTALNKGLELMKTRTSMYEVFEGLEFTLPEKVTVSKECIIKINYESRYY